jgi:hypothetical protein
MSITLRPKRIIHFNAEPSIKGAGKNILETRRKSTPVSRFECALKIVPLTFIYRQVQAKLNLKILIFLLL